MQTIGERLEEARRRRGVSLRDAAEATKIRGDFLQSFENNEFDIGLPELYVRGFLRNYGQFLRLSGDQIAQEYQASLTGNERSARERSRELFGRIEVHRGEPRTVSPASPTGVPAPGAAAAAGTEVPAPPDRQQQIRVALTLVVAGLVLAVLFFIVRAILAPGEETTAARPGSDPAARPAVGAGAASTPAPPLPGGSAATPAESFTLIARDSVYVEVRQQVDGQMLFRGTLLRGETRTLPKQGVVLITVDPGSALLIERNGQRFQMGQPGRHTARVD